jgi:fimbrial chaperone protein
MVGALAAATMVFSSAAEARRVSPMVIDLEPAGRNAVGRIEITNPADTEFPVEIGLFRGEISEAGELALTPADDDFLVFPAQVIVPARSQQVVRVQYLGSGELDQSAIYYAAIRQVPVAFTPGQSQLQVVVNFNVLVNVVPEESRAEPVVESTRPVTRDGRQGLEVKVTNRGTRYFTAGTHPWEVRGRGEDGTELDMRRTPEEMAREIGVGVVAPGRSRLFFVPTDKLLVEGSVQAGPVL